MARGVSVNFFAPTSPEIEGRNRQKKSPNFDTFFADIGKQLRFTLGTFSLKSSALEDNRLAQK